MDDENEHFRIMGLKTNATKDEIKKAYRELTNIHHPDKNKGCDGKKFEEIHKSYTFLMNRKNTSKSMYENVNKNILFEMKCSLEDLYHGKTVTVRIQRKIYKNGGFNLEIEIVNIEINKGLKDGDTIVIKGKGHQIPNEEVGDLIVKIKEKEHPVFERINNHLKTVCNISLKEALDGFTRTVTLLNGKKEIISLENLTDSKNVYVIDQGGMPYNSGFGDLIIEFKIVLELSYMQKHLILNILTN